MLVGKNSQLFFTLKFQVCPVFWSQGEKPFLGSLLSCDLQMTSIFSLFTALTQPSDLDYATVAKMLQNIRPEVVRPEVTTKVCWF